MKFLYTTIFYQPLFNALVFLYQTVAFGDLGIAIIFLTLIIRIILFPLFQKSLRHQLVMQELQPKVKKLQTEHKSDVQKQTREIMALYKEHKVNPFSGFLFLLIQLPILFALYQIFFKVSGGGLEGLYGFITKPEVLETSFLGLINLSKRSIVMVVLASVLQYFQGKISLPKLVPGQTLSPAEKVSRQMVFIGPVLTAVIFLQLPAAVSLYWATTSIFSIVQQLFINRRHELGRIPKNASS